MSNSCDSIQTELEATNVFGINTPNFTLFESIEDGCDVQDSLERFNTFCLIPAGTHADSYGETCVATTSNYPQSNWIFRELETGQVNSLNDLPILWQSSYAAIEDKNDWMEVPITISPFERFDSSNVPFVMSDNGRDIILCDADNNINYQSSADGLYYPITLNAPNNALTHILSISDNGHIKVIASQNVYWIWTIHTQQWSQPYVVNGSLLNIKVWTDDDDNLWLVYVNQTLVNALRVNVTHVFINDFDTQDIEFVETSVNNSILSLCAGIAVLPDKSRLFIVHANASGQIRINGWTLTDEDEEEKYELVFAGRFTGTTSSLEAIVTVSSLMIYQDTSTTYKASVTFNTIGMVSGTFLIDSPYTWTEVSQVLTCTQFSPSSDGTKCVYNIPDTGPAFKSFILVNQVATDITPTSLIGSETFTQNIGMDTAGTCIVLHCLTKTLIANSPGSEWKENSYDFYKPISISDFGDSSLDVNDWNGGPSWYKGNLQTTQPGNFSFKLSVDEPFTVEYKAWHQEYKIVTEVYEGPYNGSNLLVPSLRSVNPTLYRSNEAWMIQNPTYESRIYSDGNIQIYDNNRTLIWENNMHDRNSNKKYYKVIRPDTSVSMTPPNGLYITWFDENKVFYVSYYAYNNERFTKYCQARPSAFTAAISNQTNFCFDNLLMSSDPFEAKFADDRCACIGGQRLFERVFKNIDLIPQSEKSLILLNLACIMLDCTTATLNQDFTNAAILAYQGCKIPITLCSSIIRNFNVIGDIKVDQNCGSSYTDCTGDINCPLGSSCVNGKCLNVCQVTSDCNNTGELTFECDNNICVPVNPPSNGLSLGAIIGIIIGVVIVIVLIIVLCWYFLVKKKH